MTGRAPDRKDKAVQQQVSAWRERYRGAEVVQPATDLPLRQDMVTLLAFVRDNKVVGTPSTGNMPLKAIAQVTARFVNPPPLETTIGGHLFRVRSEDDVWSLRFLHGLAQVGGLLAVAPTWRWRLTPDGEKFLTLSPLQQVGFLLVMWWFGINWLIAFPFTGMGESLPPRFNRIVLLRLRALPAGRRISFAEFADQIIAETGLRWAKPDSELAVDSLRASIGRMVIDILADFGVVKQEYKEEPLGQGTIRKLVAFELKPFGQMLLESLGLLGD